MSNIIHFILLITGSIVWLCIIGTVVYCFCHLIRLLCRRPWQFIKHILPWFWIDEERWEELNRSPKMWKKINETDHRAYVYFKRRGRLGIMYDPKHEYWYQPVRHLFVIKNNA